MEQQPGVDVGAEMHSHHISGTTGSVDIGRDVGTNVSAIAPDAKLPSATAAAMARGEEVGTGGHVKSGGDLDVMADVHPSTSGKGVKNLMSKTQSKGSKKQS
jgi:hypothetical protein